MKNIYLNIYKPNIKNIKKAKKNIENNNLIGLPTETVYGLAGNPYSDKSIRKIFKLKKRPAFNPLIVHFRSLKELKKDADYNNNLIKLYKAFCPGPITFILNKKKKSKISKLVTAKKETIAVRFPKHRVALNLLKILNTPLAAPSANISSKLSPTSASDVVDEFKNKLKFILDGGRCKIGLESTIIDLTNKPHILRQGSITHTEIQKVLKAKVLTRNKLKSIRSPGQLKFHYSPGIPVFLNKRFPRKDEAFITFGKKFKDDKNYFNLSKIGSLNEAANNLYKTMRKIKNKGYKSLAVCKISNFGIGRAINDRLKKASNK
jgi:L-threonylcarbamoyladenylate synthase